MVFIPSHPQFIIYIQHIYTSREERKKKKKAKRRNGSSCLFIITGKGKQAVRSMRAGGIFYCPSLSLGAFMVLYRFQALHNHLT